MIRKRDLVFLRDILYLSLTAFGGPQAHLSLMMDRLVHRKNYLTENELLELTAVCNMLPGPTSTQTITAIGYRRGGTGMAFLTLAVWAMPATIAMTGIVLLFGMFNRRDIPMDFFRFVHPMAVGFVAFAGYRLGRTAVVSPASFIILLLATALTVLLNPVVLPAVSSRMASAVPPLVLLLGAVISNFTRREEPLPGKVRIRPRWGMLALFLSVMAAAIALGAATRARPVLLFENTYRFGSLVFGGGYVLSTMMYEQFVLHKKYLTSEEFLSGFGIVQALPGPVFSFSTYAGGMALKDWGTAGRLLGCLIGTAGIFLPGILLIFFVYPFWEQVRRHVLVRRSLEGIHAAAAGLIVAAALIMFLSTGLHRADIAVLSITLCLLGLTRTPPPVLVAAAIAAGLLI